MGTYKNGASWVRSSVIVREVQRDKRFLAYLDSRGGAVVQIDGSRNQLLLKLIVQVPAYLHSCSSIVMCRFIICVCAYFALQKESESHENLFRTPFVSS